MLTEYATRRLIVLAADIRRYGRNGKCADELAVVYQRDARVIKRVLAMRTSEGAAKVLKDDDNSIRTVMNKRG